MPPFPAAVSAISSSSTSYTPLDTGKQLPPRPTTASTPVRSMLSSRRKSMITRLRYGSWAFTVGYHSSSEAS